jgi:hypothetical protein
MKILFVVSHPGASTDLINIVQKIAPESFVETVENCDQLLFHLKTSRLPQFIFLHLESPINCLTKIRSNPLTWRTGIIVVGDKFLDEESRACSSLRADYIVYGSHAWQESLRRVIETNRS